MGALAWLSAEFPLASVVLFCIEIHVPTYASAVQAKGRLYVRERKRDRDMRRRLLYTGNQLVAPSIF